MSVAGTRITSPFNGKSCDTDSSYDYKHRIEYIQIKDILRDVNYETLIVVTVACNKSAVSPCAVTSFL